MLIFDDTVSSSSPQPPSIVLLYNAGHYLKSDTVYLFCRLQVVLGLQKFLFFSPLNVAADERSRQMNMSLFKRCRPSFETGSVALSLSLYSCQGKIKCVARLCARLSSKAPNSAYLAVE